MARTAAARPHQYLAKMVVAQVMVDHGRPDLAEPFARKAIEDTEGISTPYVVLGRVHYEREEFEEAMAMLQAAREKRHIDPESPQLINYYLGKMIGRDPARTEEAFAYFLEVLRRPSSDFHLRAILAAAEMYGNAGDVEKQRHQLTRGLDFHPEDPQLLAALEAIEEGPEDE
jgi:tetratricopeptide (TPR) repeat protein